MRLSKKTFSAAFCVIAGIFCVLFAAWLVITNTQTPEFNGAAAFSINNRDYILQIYGSDRVKCEEQCSALIKKYDSGVKIIPSDKIKSAAAQFGIDADEICKTEADSELYDAAVADNMVNVIKSNGFSAGSVDGHAVSAHLNIAKGGHLWEFDVKESDDSFIKIGKLELDKSRCAAVATADTDSPEKVRLVVAVADSATDAELAAQICTRLDTAQATEFLKKAGIYAIVASGDKKLYVSDEIKDNFTQNILSEYK